MTGSLRRAHEPPEGVTLRRDPGVGSKPHFPPQRCG
jgi:hypothetical protein